MAPFECDRYCPACVFLRHPVIQETIVLEDGRVVMRSTDTPVTCSLKPQDKENEEVKA